MISNQIVVKPLRIISHNFLPAMVFDYEVVGILENILGTMGTDGHAVPSLAEQENLLVQRAVDFYGASVAGKRQAAKALGISLATLYKRMKVLSM